MDERKDSKRLKLAIPQIGDLVKVINHEFYHGGVFESVDYGIIVDDCLKNHQIKIFPEVSVYILKTGRIVPIPLGGVEIISNCKRDR